MTIADGFMLAAGVAAFALAAFVAWVVILVIYHILSAINEYVESRS